MSRTDQLPLFLNWEAERSEQSVVDNWAERSYKVMCGVSLSPYVHIAIMKNRDSEWEWSRSMSCRSDEVSRGGNGSKRDDRTQDAAALQILNPGFSAFFELPWALYPHTSDSYLGVVWVSCSSQETFGNIRRHFGLSQLVRGCCWHLVDKIQGCRSASYNVQDSPYNEEFSVSKCQQAKFEKYCFMLTSFWTWVTLHEFLFFINKKCFCQTPL